MLDAIVAATGVGGDERLRDELLARAGQDQAVRAEVCDAAGEDARQAAVERMHALDAGNTAWLREIVEARGWPGASMVGEEGAHAAWLLVQHTPDHGFQRRCLPLLEQAVADGEAAAVDLAYLTDRVLLRDGQPQRCGTQFALEAGERLLLPVDDPQQVAARRRRVGLPPLPDDVGQVRRDWPWRGTGSQPQGPRVVEGSTVVEWSAERAAAVTPEAMAALRDAYVDGLVEAGAVSSPAVERAIRTVARHRFVEGFAYHEQGVRVEVRHDPTRPDPQHLAAIYADRALVTRWHADGMPASSTSQPTLVARMLGLLDLAAGVRMLEIGAGTGYHAALCAELVGDDGVVVSVDVAVDVVDQTRRLLAAAGYQRVRVLHRDGSRGAVEHAPFDRIVATVGCGDLAPAWADQLAPGGFMLVPLEHAGVHPLVRLRPDPDGGALTGQIVGWSGFMPATGAMAHRPPWPQGWVLPGPDDQAVGHQRPVWPGYGSGEEMPGADTTVDECGLHVYLACNSPHAAWGPHGPGLTAGRRGYAAVSDGVIRWAGDPAIVAELDRLHDEWAALGRPGPGDYQLTFHPKRADHTDAQQFHSTIERRHFIQHLRVPMTRSPCP